jgi:hypothetical protein
MCVYLEVGGIPVALIGGGLELLVDPGLELVGVALEVHEAAGVLQAAAALLRRLLEQAVPRNGSRGESQQVHRGSGQVLEIVCLPACTMQVTFQGEKQYHNFLALLTDNFMVTTGSNHTKQGKLLLSRTSNFSHILALLMSKYYT